MPRAWDPIGPTRKKSGGHSTRLSSAIVGQRSRRFRSWGSRPFRNRRSTVRRTQIEPAALRAAATRDGRCALYALSRMFATLWAYHCPPRAVAIPRAFRASAISLSVRAPAFWASRMIGRTLAA